MSNQPLLGDTSTSWCLKAVIGAAVGTCLAAFVVASTNATLYAAPTVGQAQATAIFTPLVAKQAGRSSAVFAAPIEAEVNGDSTFYKSQSSSWTPLAAVAGIPLAIAAAISMWRSTTKKVIVDPIDLTSSVGGGCHWNMVASSGQYAIAKNYASALIELGEDGQCLEQLHTDLDNFASLWADEEFASFFLNPLIEAEKHKEIIEKVGEESQMSPITQNFLCFLVDKKRIPQLPAIIKEFDDQFYEATGTQVATVTAAVPLNEDELRVIANKLHEITKGKNVKIKSEVNEDLLAGFVLEYGRSGSQRIDLSLRGQLEELRGELQQGITSMLNNGVPAGVQLAIAGVGINALLAGDANAASGNIFDFGLTMPVQMAQFLLLMIFLEKVVFTPVGKVLDDRAAYIREKSQMGADNRKEIDQLNAQAEQLLEAARRDAAKQLEQAKKEANDLASEKLAKAKAELEASLERSVEEIKRSKEELWAKLEEEVVEVLSEDIVNKVLEGEEEEPAAAAAFQGSA